MHWLLVLFMTVGDAGSVVKTDLVFSTKGECFKYEEEAAQENIKLINENIRSMREKGASPDDINKSMEWTSRQLPRGTCIPTVSTVTMGKKQQ